MKSTKLVFAHTNKDNNNDNELHHLCNKNKKIKNKKRGDNEFQVCHPLRKNKETIGAMISKKTNTPKAGEGKFVNGIGQWNELL
jgi:hypothetical protein